MTRRHLIRLMVWWGISLTAISSCIRSAPALRIVILGSSTAYGIGARPFDSSFVNLLRNRIHEQNPNVTLINLGYPGYTTYQLLPTRSVPPPGRPEPDMMRNVTMALMRKPDLVIIHLPSNDIISGFSEQEIIANYSVICGMLRARHIPFLLTAGQPRNVEDASVRLRLRNVHQVLGRSFGADRVVSYFAQLSTADGHIAPELSAGDGIHVNNRGHRIVYQAFWTHPALQQFLQKRKGNRGNGYLF